MNRRLSFLSCIFALLASSSVFTVGQVSTGIPPFSSTSGGPDVINLGNLNVHLSVPVLSKAGRGIPFNFVLNYDSSVWYPTAGLWQSAQNWGWTAPGNGITGWFRINDIQRHCIDPDTGFVVFYYQHFFRTYYDAFGTAHPISGGIVVDDSICGAGSITNGSTTDGSGYVIQPTDAQDAQVLDRSGKQIDVASSGTVLDNNGNEITTTGGKFYDTLSSTTPVLQTSGGSPSPLVYQYTDTTGQPRYVTVYYASKTVQTYFNCTGISEYGPTSVNLVDHISYQDGSQYAFTYENTPNGSGNFTGRIASVTLPTGGTINYSYTGANNGIECADGSTAGLKRTTQDSPVTGTTYSRSFITGTEWKTTITPPDGSTTTAYFQESGNNFYETQRTVQQGSTNLQVTNTCYNGSTSPCFNIGITLPIAEVSAITQLDSGPQTRTDTFLNSATGLPTEVDRYDFGSGGPGGLLSKTSTVYKVFSDNPNILDHPTSVTVQDGAGHQQAQTTYAYDETPVAGTGAPQHVAVSISRGNPTTVTQWLNTGTSPSTIYTYDDAGNVLSAKDGNRNTTNFEYSSTYSSAFLTKTTRPPTTNSPHVSSATYDTNTGLPLSTTDENNNTTSYTYEAMLRPHTVTYPDGGSTTFTYSANSVESQQKIDSSGRVIDQTTNLDGLGRQSSTLLVDPEGNDTTETTYDVDGRVYTVTNPHRTGASSNTDGTTTYSYDALNRVTNVGEPDLASVGTSYNGNVITTTDEAGNLRQTTQDGLGRISKVVEPSPSSNSLTSGQFPTTYSYTVNTGGSSIVQITQSGDGSQSARTRTFTYDSLSRLVTSVVPESGQTGYLYDLNGNATQVTDARNITTTIGYDVLNRPTSKSYSDGTPSVIVGYDEASPWGVTGANNTVGRLSSTWISGLAGSIYIYDSMGRLIRNDQCAKSVCGTTSYPVSATYDYAGDLTSLTYPSGRQVTNAYSTAGRLTEVNYASYGGTSVNYPYYTVPQSTSSASWGYFPAGVLSQFSFGPGVSQTFGANNRFAVNQITAGTSAQTMLSKTYTFSTHNSGNITQIADAIKVGRTQNFGYDHLNRLISASSADASWSQTFSIDPWGNMKQSGTAAFVPNFDANNRISQTGYSYDAAGNLLTDTFHGYAYDGEERMKSVDTTGATYTYSADGSRSRKDVSGSYTEYVYFGGQAIAEKTSAGDWNDYIFANGQRIAKAEGLDNGLRNYGTTTASGQWVVQYFGSAAGLNGYTIQAGDKLYLTQYQLTGSKGGIVLGFTDGSNSNWTVKDAEGYYLNDDQTQNATHVRTIDLSSLAGKTINAVGVNQEADTAVGSWAIIYEQTSLLGLDGSVHPIYTGEASSPLTSNLQSGGETGIGSSIDVNHGHAIYPTQTTTYYVADHLGSSRMILSGNGYPVWSGVFLPYGQEWNPQITMNTYKFTGDEHDAESNLEHTWFRQYEGTEGRWLSPDPYLGSMDLSNPQTLNRYAYVTNAPLTELDPNGLHPLSVYEPEDWGCTLSGTYSPCSLVNSVIGAGAACIGSCTTTVTGSNGKPYQITQTAGPTVYTGPNGEELSSGDIAELGLTQPWIPGLDSDLGPFGNGGAGGSGPSNGSRPDRHSCGTRLAQGVLKNTGVSISKLQYIGTIGGHANYTFDVADSTAFQNILDQRPPWPLPFGLDKGSRYGLVPSTHIENTIAGGFSGHTDLFNGHALAPLHWIVDVGIGHIPGVNLDFGCKAAL